MKKLFLTICLLMICSTGWGDSLTIQLGTNGTSYTGTPHTGDKNALQITLLQCRYSDAGRFMILWFDLSDIPSGSTINSATMSINVYEEYNSGTVNHNAGRILDPDSTGGWDDNIADSNSATWNEKAETDNIKWDNAGTDILDVVTEVGDTISISATGWHNFDMAVEVQNMVDAVYLNAGFYIKEAAASNIRAYSNAYATASSRPKLVIDYTPPAGGGFGAFMIKNIF